MLVIQSQLGKTLQVGWKHNRTPVESAGTVCYIKDGTERISTGVAALNPNDNYCRNTGRKISLARAIEQYTPSVRKVFWEAYFAMRNDKW